MKLKRFEGTGYAGYSFWCAGCKERHMVNTEESDGKGRPVWGFNGDLERPVFTPSVLVWWTEPANLGNPEALQRDLDEAAARRAAGEVNVKIQQADKRCHTFVGCNGAEPGQIIYLGDCTHALAGQTIDLPDLPVPKDVA